MPLTYLFNDYELAQATRSLRCAGQDVPVQPKVFDLLVLLLRYREQVISKQDLQAALWPQTSVGDAALTRLIKEARRAVGDDGDRQAVIKTVQRKGYRFVADVHMGGEDGQSRGVQNLVNAGEQALQRDAHVEAEQHYRAAIALLSDHSSADAALLCDTLLALAETQRSGSSGAVDQAVLVRALAVARVHALWDHYALAALALARDLPNWRINQELLGLLDDARQRCSRPVLRARLLGRMATEYSLEPFEGPARQLRDQSLTAARDAGPEGLLAVLRSRDDWVWQGVAPADRSQVVERCEQYAASAADPSLSVDASLLRLRECLESGPAEDFERLALQLEARVTGSTMRRARYRLQRLRIARATTAGHFQQAQDWLDEVVQPPCGLGVGEVWDDQTAQTSSLLAARERMHDIGPVCAPSADQSPAVTARCVQLWLSACTAEHVQARYELRKLLPVGDPRLLHPADAALVAASCALLDEPAPAQALEHALQPLSGRHVLRGEVVCYGPCDYFLGVLAQLRDQPERAHELFVRAETLAQRSGMRLSLIRVRLHMAQVSRDAVERTRLAELALADAAPLGLSQAAALARSLRA